MNAFVSASRSALSSSRDWVVFLMIALIIFWLLVLVPVWTTPGNDVPFQLSLLTPPVYALMGVLSLSNALLLLLHRHIRRVRHLQMRLGGKVAHAATGFGILAGAVASTIACAACYSSLLALLGFGGALFVLEHRWWIAAAALVLTGLALWNTSKRIVNGCDVCVPDQVDSHKGK